MTPSERLPPSTAPSWRRRACAAAVWLAVPLLLAGCGGGGNAGGFFDGTPYVGDVRPSETSQRFLNGRPVGPDGQVQAPAVPAVAGDPVQEIPADLIVPAGQLPGADEPALIPEDGPGSPVPLPPGSAGPYSEAPSGGTQDRIRIGAPPATAEATAPRAAPPTAPQADPRTAPQIAQAPAPATDAISLPDPPPPPTRAGPGGAIPGTGTAVGTGNVNNDGVRGYPNLADVPRAPDDIPTLDERMAVQRELIASREATGGATVPPPNPVAAPVAPQTQAGGPPRGGPVLPADAPGSALAALGALDAQTQAAADIGSGVIYFGHGSAALSAEDRALLRSVAQRQRQTGEAVRIVGYASSSASGDAIGRHVANLDMAIARADAVAALLRELGVPAAAIESSASTEGGDDERLARRVEISLGA